MSDFIIRPAEDSHRAFILATWLRSYQASSPLTKKIPKGLFFDRHHDVVEALLARPETEAKVALWAEDPEIILGYAVTEGTLTVHYVYVKPAFRQHGIATALLAETETPFIYTHFTYALQTLHRKMEKCVFDPYAALLEHEIRSSPKALSVSAGAV